MKMTYALIKKLIAKGETNIDELKNKMDIFLVAGRLTEEEYTELTSELNAETEVEAETKTTAEENGIVEAEEADTVETNSQDDGGV